MRSYLAASLAVAFLLSTGPASAQSTWTGTGANGNWSTPGNWQGSVAPTSANSTAIIFGGSTGLSSNVDSAFTLGSLTFNSGSGAFVLGGSTITLHGTQNYNNDINNRSASTITINNNITLNSTSGISNSSTGSLVLNGNIGMGSNSVGLNANGGSILQTGVISGSGQFEMNGSGTITLDGTNTFSGIVSFYSSTVLLGSSVLTNTNGALGNSANEIQMGASSSGLSPTLLTNGAFTVSRKIRLITPTTGSNTYTIGGNTADASSFTGTIYLNTASGTVAANALNVTAASGGVVTISGNIIPDPSGGGTGTADSLTKKGLGEVVLSGFNAYTGATFVNAGALNIQGGSSLGTSPSTGTTGVTVSSGAALQLQNNISTTTVVPLTLNGAGVAASPQGALENVNGSNTYSGLVTLASSSTIGSDAGTLILNNTGSITGSGFGLTLTGSGNGSLASNIATGTGGVTKSGTGAWIVSGTNLYSGGTTVSSGTLYVNSGVSGTSSGTGSGAVTVNSGGTLAGSGNIATGSTVTVNSGGTISSGRIQTGGTSVTGPGLTITASSVALTSATLTFNLGAGDTTGDGYHTFGTPNTNTTYLTLAGSTSINFAGTNSISLVDLTTGNLALRQGTPYLLISASSDAAYTDLVTMTGFGASAVYTIDGNGYVVGVAANGYTGGSGINGINSTDFTAISINQFGPDGVTPLANGTLYPAPVLYLNNGDLEVVPEPGTWALMLGGVAVLVFWQRRQRV